MKKSSGRENGVMAEAAVADFLQENGYTILERNYYTQYGELDIIATRDNTIIFVEVKYRKTDLFGLPAEAVTRKKIKRLIKSAQIYLFNHNITDAPTRFDVAEVRGDFDDINILEGAIDSSFASIWEE